MWFVLRIGGFVFISWVFAFVFLEQVARFCCWLIYVLASPGHNDDDADDAGNWM